MPTLVVGSTGVIGRPTIERLLRDGHHVRALIREPSSAPSLIRLGAEPIVGDLLDPASLGKAADGVDVVVNVSSAIPTGRDATIDSWRVNDAVRTTGTSNLVTACVGAGVVRLIHTSVYLVYGIDRRGEVLDERAELRPSELLRSAVDGEQIARDTAAQHELDVIIMRPGWLYSPGSWHTLDLLDRLRAGEVACHPDAWTSAIHADDLAAFIGAAVTGPNGVGTINVAAEPEHTYELYAAVAGQLGWPMPGIAQEVERSSRVDSRRAREVLGWTATRDTANELVYIARSMPAPGEPQKAT